MANFSPPKDRDSFRIAVVCALERERDAIEAILEVNFRARGHKYGKVDGDRNQYIPGVLGGQLVVLVTPGEMGTTGATIATGDMRFSYKDIKLCLVVGVAGGAPQTPERTRIRLGDVIISTQVISYGYGAQYPDGFQLKTEIEDTLGRPDVEIRSFLRLLKGSQTTERIASKASMYSSGSNFHSRFAHPGPGRDHLFPNDYRHKHRRLIQVEAEDGDEAGEKQLMECELCKKCNRWDDPVCEAALKANCNDLGCDISLSGPGMTKDIVEGKQGKSEQKKPAREDLQGPVAGQAGEGFSQQDNSPEPQSSQSQAVSIHFGRIASANSVLKSGVHREKIVKKEKVVGFEMEGAGTWDQFPTIIVKSVCDYADSHKNKAWQDHAAAVAASCAKAILEEWEGPDQPAISTGPTLTGYNVPFSLEGVPALPDGRFIGRTEQLEQICNFLYPDVATSHRRKVFVLYGMGGIGKTQLAAEFARRYREAFSAVFWLNGASEESLAQSFAAVAERIQGRSRKEIASDVTSGSDGEIKEVKEWLSIPENGNWLLIIDNVDDESEYRVVDVLPAADHGSVLITSRLLTIARLGMPHPLAQVSEYEARSILEQEAGAPLQDIELLLQRLCGLPLALTQAGAYLNMTGLSVKDYITIYDGTWSELMEQQDQYQLQEYEDPRHDQAQRSLRTTWMLSYRQVESKNASAAELLKLWSILGEGMMFFEIISGANNLEREEVPTWLKQLSASKLKFIDAIGVLSAYSLADRTVVGGLYTLHPVILKWSYSLLTREESQVLVQLVRKMIKAFLNCNKWDPEDIELQTKIMLAHVTISMINLRYL